MLEDLDSTFDRAGIRRGVFPRTWAAL